jgi:hypothetical protein
VGQPRAGVDEHDHLPSSSVFDLAHQHLDPERGIVLTSGPFLPPAKSSHGQATCHFEERRRHLTCARGHVIE